SSSCSPLDLHSFPTRRSSDLQPERKDILALVFRRAADGLDRQAGNRNAEVMIVFLPLGLGLHVIGVVQDDAALLERIDVVFVRRSEEHTSELQSRENLVCRLL